jgi:hypothetical protein
MAISGARANALVAELSAPLLNRALPKVGGKDLATLSDTVGPEAPGIIENRVSRGEAELAKKGATEQFDKLAAAARNLRSAQEAAPSGTGELVSAGPLTTGSFIMDSTYYRYLGYALKKMAKVPPEQPNDIEKTVFDDWTARTSGGTADARAGAVTIAEVAADPAISRKGFLPVIDRSNSLYRAAVTELSAAGVGGLGALGAPDRTMIADALFSTPKGSAPPVLLTTDQALCRSLAAHFATDTESRGLFKGYPGLVARGGFTIEIPGVPGWQLQIKPL